MIRYCGRCLSTFDGDPTACPNLGCGSRMPPAGWGTVLGVGDVLDRRYKIERCLAVGGAGLTYLAREVDASGESIGPKVAIKVLYTARASGSFLRRLSNEAQILQELAHENIVELRGFVHRAGDEPYLVTRFEEGGSLAQHIERVGPVPPKVAAAILRQILLALDVAHQRGVVHRDLKPDNVLLAADADATVVPLVRLTDFGIAKISGGMGDRLTRIGAFVGTPEYAAPEQFEAQTPTPATDVFASGALLIYLLTGAPPFRFSQRHDIESSYEELLQQVPVRLPAMDGVEPTVLGLLQQAVDGMLAIVPQDRWTISRVLSSLAPVLDVQSPRGETIDMSVVPASTISRPRSSPPSGPPPTPAPLEPETVPGAPPPLPPSAFGDEPLPIPDALPAEPTAEMPEDRAVAPEPPLLTDPAVATAADIILPSDEPFSPPVPAPPPLPELDVGSVPPAAPRKTENVPRSARTTAPPPPPAFLPGRTRTTPEPPSLEPATPIVQASGGSAGLAGCFGLSLFGMATVGTLGFLGAAVILVAVAMAGGWFRMGPPIVDNPPVVVDDAEPERFRKARPLPDADQKKVVRAVRDLQPDIAKHCGTGASVNAVVLVDAAGKVVYAKVDKAKLGKVEPGCVKKGLERIKVRGGLTGEGTAPVQFPL